MGRTGSFRVLIQGTAIAALAVALAGCESIQSMQGTVQNLSPQWSEFHPLPDAKSFAPTNVSSYALPLGGTGAVGPGDLVDGQGMCSGAAPAAAAPDGSPAPALSRSVALGMTECEVSRALGPPAQAEIGGQGSARVAVLTYMSGERPGIYRFVNGRLSTIDRGNAPPPPPVVAKKPPPKKPKPPPAPPPA
jgi:hypothetical protein